MVSELHLYLTASNFILNKSPMRFLKELIALLLVVLLILSCSKDKPIVSSSNYKSLPFNGADLLNVFFLNSTQGYTAERNGVIRKTVDGGISWSKLNTGTILNITSVFFLNDSIGFAGGEFMTECITNDCNKSAILLKTRNGGTTWTKEFKPDIARFYGMYFFNEAVGIGILMSMESKMVVARTDNAGSTWNYLDLNITNSRFGNVEIIVKNTTCYILGDNRRIFKTKDRGINWDSLYTPVQSVNAGFVDENTGFITDNSSIFKTSTGGFNWQKVNNNFSLFGKVHFSSELNGIAIGYKMGYTGGDWPTAISSRIYSTSDGGVTWTKKDDTEVISGIFSFPADKVGYCFSTNKIYILPR